MLVFEERGKPEFPEKNLLEQSREPTNSAHIWRRVRESNPGHIGGRRALSPLHQPCSPYKMKYQEEEVAKIKSMLFQAIGGYTLRKSEKTYHTKRHEVESTKPLHWRLVCM